MNDRLSITTLAAIDAHRAARGFMAVAELLDVLGAGQNIVLDPFSILVSKGVEIGSGNVLYPNVIIEATNAGGIRIGGGNVFYPGTMLLADRGSVAIGDSNEIGSGGVQIKAAIPDAAIHIGSEGRYMNGAAIVGQCTLGSGSQVLGAITVEGCTLEPGDSYKGADPDMRAGVLKGFGVARNLTVKQGEVINGRGNFSEAPVERQVTYHPKKA